MTQFFKASTSFNFDVLSERLQESAFLLKNLKITLNDLRSGKERQEHYHYEKESKSLLVMSMKEKKFCMTWLHFQVKQMV